MTPLLLAAREGHIDSVAGAARRRRGRQPGRAPATGPAPLLIATINGHFDLAKLLLEQRRRPERAAENNGVTPLYARAERASGRRRRCIRSRARS